MKNTFRKAILVLTLLLATSYVFAAGKIMYVNERNAPLKASTSLMAKQIASLKYATEVEVITTKGAYSKVKVVDNPKMVGWIKTSYLTSKKLKKGTAVSTDATDITLAGKGNETTVIGPAVEKPELIDAK